MSPVALGLALSLHALAAAVLWWATPLQPIEPADDAIMVTVDSGAPPTTMDQPSGDKPAPPAAAGTPDPVPPEQPREEPQQALAEPQSPQPPQPAPSPSPSLKEAPASPQELPPPTAHDFPTIRMPLPPWPSPRPSQAAQSPPPRLPQPAPALPPPNAPASVQAPPSNSADWLVGKSRARNAYLDQVARLTLKYRRYPHISADANQQVRVVTRVTIARDGRLIDVSIDTSSGWPAVDAAELEAIRRSAPFPAVPVDMPGDPLILILPINYHFALSGSR